MPHLGLLMHITSPRRWRWTNVLQDFMFYNPKLGHLFVLLLVLSRCISFTEFQAPAEAEFHFEAFSCKMMKQLQTPRMNRERIWHKIDIYCQSPGNVWGDTFQAHPFSCKTGLLLFFYSEGFLWLFNGEQEHIKLDSQRRAHLSLVIGPTQHKESSACLDENVDGWDVMHAKGIRQRSGVLDVLIAERSALCLAVSVIKGFNFALRPFASSFLRWATEVLQSPLNHHSPFAQYIWITGKKITTPALTF